VRRLEALPGWVWNVHASLWNQGFERLMRRKAEAGTVRVRNDFIDSSGYPLGEWCTRQRRRYWSGALTPDRRAQLEALIPSGWTWGRPYKADPATVVARVEQETREHELERARTHWTRRNGTRRSE
jgi:hypothetical protein